MNRIFLLLVFILVSTTASATVETRATGQSGVATNIADNSSGAITPTLLRTELNDLWDSSVLQGELSTLVDPLIDAAITGIGGTSEYLYTPTDGTCTTDMSSEFEAFLTAHNGIIIQKANTCIRLDDGGLSINYVFEGSTNIIWRCQIEGQCQAGNTYNNSIIKYAVPDAIAFDSKTMISSVVNNPSTAVNKDDVLPYVNVASVSGYSVGDIVKIVDSIPLPNRLGSTKTITGVAWDGVKCIVTTSASHGYSDSNFITIKGITATVGGTLIDYLDGAEGYGRTYNITSLSSTTFSLQTLDNTTGSSTGSAVDCSTGTYASGGVTMKQATRFSEDAKVAGVDAVLNRIYLTHKLGFAEGYLDQPVLYRYTQARKVDIRGIKFKAIGNTSDITVTISDPAIDITGVPRATFQNIECFDNWDACLFLRSTPEARINNIKSNKLPNRNTDNSSSTLKSVVTITTATQAVFGVTGHGYSNETVVVFTGMPSGWTSFNSVACRVSDAATDTFKCKDTYGNYLNSNGFSPAYAGGASVGGASDSSGKLGYTVNLYAGQFGSVIDGIYAEEGRHAVTTDGAGISWKATLSSTDVAVGSFGVPTYYLVQNGRCSSGNGICWDEHEESYRGVWVNLLCDYPLRGADFGSYKGQCGQFRGDGSVIDNFRVLGGQSGIRFPPSDWFRDRQFSIGRLECRNTQTLQDSVKRTDKCFQAGNVESGTYTDYTNTAKFDINEIITTSVSLPVWTDKRVSVNINSMVVSDYDDMIYCQAGANVSVNSVISSHEDPKTSVGTWSHRLDVLGDGFNMINMLSDGTYNGCTARLGNVINTQGTGSNYLQDIFEAVDATATKNWYLGSYTEHNPNSTTASRITEASTGFTQLTTSSVVFVENPTIAANDNAVAILSPTAADAGSSLVLTGQGSSEGVEIDPNNNGGTREFRFRPDIFRFIPEDSTSTSAKMQFQTFADTSVLTGESSQITFGSAVTRTHDTGNYATQREFRFTCPTNAYDGASTIDDAYCLYIGQAPGAGTNATYTRNGALWVDNGVSRFDQGIWTKNPLVTLASAGTASTPSLTETGTLYINDTAATVIANITLPSASVADGSGGFSACVRDADGIKITAASGDVIYVGTTASSAGGYIQATAIGSCVELKVVDTTNWMATSLTGSWSAF